MITGLILPRPIVIASHIFKHAWKDYAQSHMGFADIDDVRNGLAMAKPAQHAFDHGEICFLRDRFNRMVCKLLNPNLHDMCLVDYISELSTEGPQGFSWQEWADWEPVRSAMGNMTFGQLEGRYLHPASAGSASKAVPRLEPFRRCLWLQASIAADRASKVRGVKVPVDDFFSDDFPVKPNDKVLKWLQEQCASPASYDSE